MQQISRSKLIKKLDGVFSEYIRLRDSDANWYVTCPLCGSKIHWKKAQNMHFISRAVLKYRYDEDNCHAGCVRCNVILHGNYIVYTRRMQTRYGIDRVDAMIKDKSLYKISTPDLLDMFYDYRNKAQYLEAILDIRENCADIKKLRC